ncbi:MAG: hypothetical protein IT158_29060 [Bryobacterales bacterium]|nr:hypothetical protein [Bryobacterales bacterium]
MRTCRILEIAVWVVLLALIALPAAAEDISGQWKAEFKTLYGGGLPRESGETTFTFKQKGEELTGTVKSTAFEETEIREGKISGDQVSFAITRTFGRRERKMTYNGTLAGGEINFQTSIEGFGRGVRMVARKVQ